MDGVDVGLAFNALGVHDLAPVVPVWYQGGAVTFWLERSANFGIAWAARHGRCFLWFASI